MSCKNVVLYRCPGFYSPPGPATTHTPRSLVTPHPLWPQEVAFLRTCRQIRMWSPHFHLTWNQIWQLYHRLQVRVPAFLKRGIDMKHFFTHVLFGYIWCVVWLHQRWMKSWPHIVFVPSQLTPMRSCGWHSQLGMEWCWSRSAWSTTWLSVTTSSTYDPPSIRH